MYKIIIQTLTAPQREGHLQSSASTHDDMSVGPILCSSYAGNCCCSESMGPTSLSCPDDSISQCSSHPVALTLFLFPPPLVISLSFGMCNVDDVPFRAEHSTVTCS